MLMMLNPQEEARQQVVESLVAPLPVGTTVFMLDDDEGKYWHEGRVKINVDLGNGIWRMVMVFEGDVGERHLTREQFDAHPNFRQGPLQPGLFSRADYEREHAPPARGGSAAPSMPRRVSAAAAAAQRQQLLRENLGRCDAFDHRRERRRVTSAPPQVPTRPADQYPLPDNFDVSRH